MNTKTSNYSKQFITLYHKLNSTINNLYHMAFSIGLQWEWQELKSEIKDRGWLPLDMAHLKVIEHPAMPGIIRMIEILEAVRERAVSCYPLTKEELTIFPETDPSLHEWLAEDYSEEENLDMWQQNLFVDLLSIFEACWNLEYNSNPSILVYDQFDKMYFNAALKIPSADKIVQMVIEALNETLRVNSRAVYVL